MTNNFCESHEGQKIVCYCLDPRCKLFPACCYLCLKKEHTICKDHFIVSVEEGTKRVNLIKNAQDVNLITKKLNQVFELKLYEMNKNLINKKKSFLQAFEIKDSPENVLDPSILPDVKKNFNFEIDKENTLIKISSKFNATEEQLNDSFSHFEKEVEKKILAFIDDFSKLKFVVRKGGCLADDWMHHENIQIEDVPEGVHFKRKEENTENNYFCSLYTQPLDTSCLFKINIEAVYESDRYVDIGIIPKSRYEDTKSNFLNSFDSGSISFCGTNKAGGLEGSSGDGLKPGSHFYLKYDPGVEVAFYNDDMTINLKKNMSGVTEEYYLFGTCYYPQVAFVIERIE
jgi:hypothetical protein